MKLHSNPASPFVRKVLVLAHELGLSERLELVPERVSPVSPNETVYGDNPLGKIPALVTDDGTALYDSRVVCEFLDTLHVGAPMFPAAGEARWTALRRQALADGLMDAAVAVRYENLVRPEEGRWQGWVDGQMTKVRRAADAMEREADALDATLDIGTIAVGCALGYLDFRYPDEGWRDARARLAAWFEGFSARPSMQATVPHELG
jgi:glutathione S-transferase